MNKTLASLRAEGMQEGKPRRDSSIAIDHNLSTRNPSTARVITLRLGGKQRD